MTISMIRLLLPAVFTAALAACVTSTPDEPVRILRSAGDGVVLHGLIDATRSTPPERYDMLAQRECARVGKHAVFAKMEQKSTFGFDLTYHCESKA